MSTAPRVLICICSPQGGYSVSNAGQFVERPTRQHRLTSLTAATDVDSAIRVVQQRKRLTVYVKHGFETLLPASGFDCIFLRLICDAKSMDLI